MAKYDGLDGYCNISEKYINLYSQAVDFFQKNDLAKIAKQRGWSNGEMFEALISPLKGLKGDFQRCYNFSIPTEKALTKSGNFASPAAFTYVVTMGLKTRDDSTCELTPIGKYLIDKRLSVQSYSLMMLSKVGVYENQDPQKRISNLLTVFCKYAINHPNEKYNPETLENVVSSVGIIDARTDISFNAFVISGLLSITEKGEYIVSLQDNPIIKEIAEHGDSISGPENGAQSFMGTCDKGILEIINPDNSDVFTKKYADLVEIKGLKHLCSDSYDEDIDYGEFKNHPLQQIYYGAPGTGKSDGIEKIINGGYLRYDAKDVEDALSSYLENNPSLNTTSKKNYFKFLTANVYSNIFENIIGKRCLRVTECHSFEDAQKLYNAFLDGGKLCKLNTNSLPSSALNLYSSFIKQYVSTHPKQAINKVCSIRTTFHPDSDHSTFVGCYKPTMDKPMPIYGFDSVGNTVMAEDPKGEIVRRREITYKFVPQAFTHAYLEAWRKFEKNEPVLLVIEEINRGNCAQIFGDLFQLLDRNKEGYSTYPIVPDTDLGSYIGEQGLNVQNALLKSDTIEDINSGKVLVLPPNLYIWATMNTSDQSLFPIDSAFKRRWDWTYVPIKYEKTEWKVVLSDNSWCSWTELQTTLNDLIYDATESEDKMLGDWFVKADEKNEITEEQLVGKIIFYLWNDVAKVDAGTLFDLEVAEKRGKNKRVTFSDFYEMSGKTNTTIVKEWLTKIGITINEAKPADDGMEDDDDPGENVPERVSDTNMPYRVTFPDGEVICNGNGWDTYVAALRKIGLDKALPYGEIFHRKNKTLPLITTKRIPGDGIYKYYDVDGYYVLSGTDSQHRLLKRMNKDLNLGLTIE